MFIFNPMIHVAKTKLGIEFEHVNMLKIQSVQNSSDTFAFILPQQRPVMVSAHAQNFFGKKKLWREIQIAQPPIQLQGCLRLIFAISTTLWKGFNDIVHVFWVSKRPKVKVKYQKMKPTSGHKQTTFYKIFFKNWYP